MQELRDYLEEKVPVFDTVRISYAGTNYKWITHIEDPNMDKEAKDYLLETEEEFASLDGVKADEAGTAFFLNGKMVFSMTVDEFVTLLCDLDDEEEE